MNNKIKEILFYIAVILLVSYLLYQKGYIGANYESITPNQAVDLIKNDENNITILDVRTLSEYRAGHLKNSILIPIDTLEQNLNKLASSKDKKILVYCASGNRSASASRILEKNSYHPYNIEEGISGLARAGQRVVLY